MTYVDTSNFFTWLIPGIFILVGLFTLYMRREHPCFQTWDERRTQ